MGEKKKLFLMSPMLHQGGFERVCITTANVLKDIFDVTIVIFSDADIAFDTTGLNIVNLDVPTKPGPVSKVINIFKRVKKFKGLLLTESPDLIYSFGLTAGLINALSSTKKGNGPRPVRWMGLRSYLDVEEELLMKLFISKSDRIVCCSKEIEEFVRAYYHTGKTATLYNLYNLEGIKESVKEVHDIPEDFDKRYTIVSMGRDDYKKGYWHMIKAFKILHDEESKARMIILGDGEFIECKKLTKELGLESAIYFAGMKTDPYNYVARAGIYLLTSNTEGFPNALVEGMCLGLTAVATNCKSGPAEILLDECSTDSAVLEKRIADEGGILKADFGLLINDLSSNENYNADAMDEEVKCAEALISLFKDDALYEDYCKRAVKGASRFDYSSYVNRFVEIAKADGITV